MSHTPTKDSKAMMAKTICGLLVLLSDDAEFTVSREFLLELINAKNKLNLKERE